MWTTTIFTWTVLVVLPCLMFSSEGAYKDEQYLDTIGCSSHKIFLQSNKTLIIKLSRWEDYHRGLSFLNFHCKFQVVAPRGYGIMAIVQLLHLRTKNVQGSGCRDYIQMENMDGLEAGPICGEVLEGDSTEQPKLLVGPRSFYDPKGILDVSFKFDDSRLNDDQKPFKLEISFTAYTECTSTALLMRQVRQCSVSRPYSCIAQNLFCDGVINCGNRGDFGSDETGPHCAPPTITSDVTIKSAGSKPLVHDGPIHRFDIGSLAEDEDKIPAKVVTGRKHEQGDDDDSTSSSDMHLGVPVQYFALVSAICGALVVWLVVIICCCFVRSMTRRNVPSRHSPSQRTVEINLSHSNAPISQIPVRNDVTLSNNGIIAKTSEDLPPSYEAIFPDQPVPHKR